MVILAIADRPPRESILGLIQKHAVELVCTLGDLDYFALEELDRVTDIPKIGVYGNHCSGVYFESLGIMDMHLKTFEYKGVTFGGFEGSLRYKDSDYGKMYTQEEASDMLQNFPTVDVMLAHSPPFGVNDEEGSPSHQGLVGLQTYVEKKKPRYFLHGHTYPTEENITTAVGGTSIIYVYQDKIVTV